VGDATAAAVGTTGSGIPKVAIAFTIHNVSQL